MAWARRVLDAPPGFRGELAGVSDLGDAVFGELLPDWYDDWLVVERERLRELRVRALERVCERLTALRSFGQRSRQDWLPCTPSRCAERAPLPDWCVSRGGQPGGGAARVPRVSRSLHDELALEPSERMEDLVGGLIAR